VSSQWLVEADPIYGCSLFVGKRDRDGYGVVWSGSKPPRRAHSVAWEEARGPVPQGKELEHRCRRRNCVRIEHLKLVTRSQNEKLKSWARRARETRCEAGHDMRDCITTPEGGRLCRRCCGP